MQDDDNTAPQAASGEAEGPDQATVDKRARMKKRRRFYLVLLILVFVVIAVVYGVYWFLVLQYYASTDDAYVHGNKIMLTPQISGTVVSIGADNTDLVRAGQTLVKLDQSNARVGMAHARA